MGVPGLYSWVKKTFPRCNVRSARVGTPCTALFVDVNAVLYNVVRDWDARTEEIFMKSVYAYIMSALHHFSPDSLLYLALDGVAPASKMFTQRARRFETVGVKAAEPTPPKRQKVTLAQFMQLLNEGNAMPDWWDRCGASCGTEFMGRVEETMRGLAQDLVDEHRNLTVIISSTNVPGEGEQKIIDHARRMTGSLVVLGADADIIVMSMACVSSTREILCARDIYEENGAKTDSSNCKGFTYLKISEARAGLLNMLRKTRYGVGVSRDIADNQVIADWIAMTCFVGNDFLPHIPSLSAYLEALPRLNAKYKLHINGSGRTLVGFDKSLGRPVLDTESLIILLESLAKSEVADATSLDSLAVVRDTETSPRDAEWAAMYNNARFGARLDEACDAYLDTIEWVLEYYLAPGCPDIKWRYKFHHAPTASALLRRCTLRTPRQWDREAEPPTAQRQLMNILPPSAAHLVPVAWRPLLLSEDSPLAAGTAAAQNCRKDYTYKMRDFQAVYMLPDFDPEEMEHHLDVSLLTEDEVRRNRVADVEVYRASSPPDFAEDWDECAEILKETNDCDEAVAE